MGPATKYRGDSSSSRSMELSLAFEGACTTRCGLAGKEDGVVLLMLCIVATSESGFKGGTEIFLSQIFMRRQSAMKENRLRNCGSPSQITNVHRHLGVLQKELLNSSLNSSCAL